MDLLPNVLTLRGRNSKLLLRRKAHGFDDPNLTGGQPLNKRFVRYGFLMGGHVGSRKARRLLLDRFVNLRGCSPFSMGERKQLIQGEPDMSTFTNRKKVKQIRSLLILGVLCLCVVNIVYGQGERCQYRRFNDIVYNPATEEATLRSTGQPINGIVCDYWGSTEILKGHALFSETPFKNGKAEGIERQYSPSGRLIGETPFKNGKGEGIARRYHESGRLFIEVLLKDGKAEGIERHYDKSGRLSAEIPYKNGKKEGIERHYNESGRLNHEMPYKNDKKEGYSQTYTATGHLLHRIFYFNDSIISGVCGDGRAFTNAELINLINLVSSPSCTPKY